MAANASRELYLIAQQLKVTGDRGLRLETFRGLREAAQPLIPLVKARAEATLPKAGGLNLWVADQPVKVSVRTGARTAGVRLYTTKIDSKETDAGYVRHPVFNRRTADGKRVWAKKSQQIPAAKGWWSKTLAASGGTVKPAMDAVLRRVAAKVMGVR